MKWHIDPTKIFLYDKLVRKKTKNAEEYYLNDKLYNPNGPAYTLWYDNGRLWCEEYWLNDKHHNPNGPAFISWRDNQESTVSYYINGKHHRMDAPAYSYKSPFGYTIELFFVNDTLLTAERLADIVMK